MRKGLIKKNSGQMKLSFGMIFSIILIIAFIAFAFYAIKKFVGIQDIVKIKQFKDDLQLDIDKSWKSSQGSQEIKYTLPPKVERVCFLDYSSSSKGGKEEIYDSLRQIFYGSENMFFYPIGSAEGADAFEMKHINLEAITQEENPFCINNQKGEIKLTIKKDYGEALVLIER